MKQLPLACVLLASTVFISIAAADEVQDHPTERAEVRKFFADYQQATADETAEKLIALYDFDTMVDEIETQAGVPLPPAMKRAMTAGIQRQIQQQLQLFNGVWYRHKVVTIKFFGSDDQAEVFVRGWNENQETTRQIFWVARKDNRWRIYDFMDLSMGLACTKLAAVGLKQGMAGDISLESLSALRALMKAVVQVGQEDFDAARDSMAEVEGRPIPPFIESARWFFAGAVAIIDDATLTLEYLDKATAFQPDLPLANYMRSVAYNMLGRHELAAASAQKFMDRFGADADAYYQLADALRGMEKEAEAVEQLRKSLVDTPNSLGNVELLGLLLPKDQKAELAEHFARLRDHSDCFQYLADTYEIEEDADALETLIKAMEKINPAEPLMDYYRAVVMGARGQHQRAMQSLEKSLKSLDAGDEDREWYEDLYFLQAVKADQLLALYKAAENPQQRARELFERATALNQFARLEKLIAAHLKAFPEDPDAHLMAGDVEYYLDQFESADRHYARGLQCEQQDPEVTDELIHSRVICWSELDKSIEAYQQLAPKAKVFEELVRWEDDEEIVAKLIELHRKQFPQSFAIARWSAQQSFDSEDYERVVKILVPALKRLAQPQADDAELDQRFAADNLLIRALIRLKKFDQALDAAKQAFGEEEQAFYQAIVHAANHDETAFKKAAKTCRDEYGYDEYDFIYDEDFPTGFAGLTETTEDDQSQSAELRSLAVLLSAPLPVDPQSITKAASEAWQTRLFLEQYEQLDRGAQAYVCQIADDACIVSVEGFRFFIQSQQGPYLGNANMLADEYQAELREAILQHQAVLSIDIDVWPTTDPDQEQAGIPPRAQQLMSSLALALAGRQATIITDRDTGQMRKLSPELARKLAGPDPTTAFASDSQQEVGSSLNNRGAVAGE